MKKNFRFLITYFFSIFIVFASIMPVYSSSDKVKDQLNNVKNDLKNIKGQIQDKKNDLNQISQNVIELDKKIGATEAQIVIVSQQIKDKNKEIENLKIKQEETKKDISSLEEKLSKRIKSMSRMNEMSYVKILLSSNDVKEFLSSINTMKKIISQDNYNIESLKEQKEILELSSEKLKIEEENLSKLKSDYDKNYSSLSVQKKEQAKNMSIIETDLAALKQLENQKIAESNALISQIQQMASSNGYKQKYNGIMSWPVPLSTNITSPYGNRFHPILKQELFHSGIDIAAPMGSDIISASDGKVLFSGDKGTYGRTVIIDHGSGITSLYAHCSALYVSAGQEVTKGQKVAAIGSTGRSTGPHLHFEIRENGITTNPLNYVN